MNLLMNLDWCSMFFLYATVMGLTLGFMLSQKKPQDVSDDSWRAACLTAAFAWPVSIPAMIVVGINRHLKGKSDGD